MNGEAIINKSITLHNKTELRSKQIMTNGVLQIKGKMKDRVPQIIIEEDMIGKETVIDMKEEIEVIWIVVEVEEEEEDEVVNVTHVIKKVTFQIIALINDKKIKLS